MSFITLFRRYLPILRGFPAKYIYDPWNAPEAVQKAAKCIVGVHYPKPMVNHAEASCINIERMKQIYQQLSCYRGLGKTNILLTDDLKLKQRPIYDCVCSPCWSFSQVFWQQFRPTLMVMETTRLPQTGWDSPLKCHKSLQLQLVRRIKTFLSTAVRASVSGSSPIGG